MTAAPAGTDHKSGRRDDRHGFSHYDHLTQAKPQHFSVQCRVELDGPTTGDVANGFAKGNLSAGRRIILVVGGGDDDLRLDSTGEQQRESRDKEPGTRKRRAWTDFHAGQHTALDGPAARLYLWIMGTDGTRSWCDRLWPVHPDRGGAGLSAKLHFALPFKSQ